RFEVSLELGCWNLELELSLPCTYRRSLRNHPKNPGAETPFKRRDRMPLLGVPRHSCLAGQPEWYRPAPGFSAPSAAEEVCPEQFEPKRRAEGARKATRRQKISSG